MSELLRILQERDGLSRAEAIEEIKEARRLVRMGEDPEVVLEEMFGLEPDYIMELL